MSELAEVQVVSSAELGRRVWRFKIWNALRSLICSLESRYLNCALCLKLIIHILKHDTIAKVVIVELGRLPEAAKDAQAKERVVTG